MALSWTNLVDDQADEVTLSNLKQALAVLALARTFNGVISVAQGTEVAIQPVGVGVTLTLGEILDPLNDLVEQFSALALLASVSLGLQLTLGKILASAWLSALVTVVVLTFSIALWAYRVRPPWFASLSKVLGFVVFLRFFLAIALLATHWVDSVFLQGMQDQAIENLTLTSASIQEINDQASVPPSSEDDSFFDRTAQGFNQLLDSSRQSLDIKNQLTTLQTKAESSVEEIINLIVVFLLQTLLIPVATLYACGWALRKYWSSITEQ
ncbi:MAG: hypothetical protein GKR90_21480 [Pseudomonadales bacterium]|nr:hypothetical protein [Pseudomonadales bacterium]